jgi:hypothetical protein
MSFLTQQLNEYGVLDSLKSGRRSQVSQSAPSCAPSWVAVTAQGRTQLRDEAKGIYDSLQAVLRRAENQHGP